MKKIFFAFFLATSLLLTSCFQAVFPSIREEIELLNPLVNGAINSIVRVNLNSTEYLYMQSGYISYKLAADSDQQYDKWKEAPNAPEKIHYDFTEDKFIGYQIIKLAASTDTLFALAVTYKSDTGVTEPDQKVLFKFDGSKWTEIYRRDFPEKINDYVYIINDNFTIFCTNSPTTANRRAFARIGETVYELTSSSDRSNLTTTPITGSGASKYSSSVVSFGSGVHFFDCLTATSNETSTNTTATTYYWTSTDGETIYANSTPGATSGARTKSMSGIPVYSMAYSQDSLLLGTVTEGATRVSPADLTTLSSATNVTSVLTRPYGVPMMFSLHPDKNEKDNVIYASTILSGKGASNGGSSNKVGLWAYYPSRGKWNRE